MRILYQIHPDLLVEKPADILREPIVLRVNEFGEEDLKDFEKKMDIAHKTNQPVIPVVIDSFGGSVYGLLGFIAAIESAKKPVATIVATKAMSAGAILFAFGTEGYRFMHPSAYLMIHDISSLSYGKLEEIKADAKHTEHLSDIIYEKMSKQIGHESKYIQKYIKKYNHADWYLNAKESKKHNIANHLKIPSLNVKINLEINFN